MTTRDKDAGHEAVIPEQEAADERQASQRQRLIGQKRRRQDAAALDKPYDMQAPFLKAYRRAARMLRVKPGMRLLDLGCGLGGGSFLFASLGAEVLAVDSSPQAIQWAAMTYGKPDLRKSGKLSYKVVDLARWEPDDHFDAIVIIDTMEQFPMQQGINILRRMLDSLGFVEQPPADGWCDGVFLHLPLTDNLIEWPLLLKNRLVLKRLRGQVVDHHADTSHVTRYSLVSALRTVHSAGGSLNEVELRLHNRRLQPLEEQVLAHTGKSTSAQLLSQFVTEFDGIILPELTAAIRNA